MYGASASLNVTGHLGDVLARKRLAERDLVIKHLCQRLQQLSSLKYEQPQNSHGTISLLETQLAELRRESVSRVDNEELVSELDRVRKNLQTEREELQAHASSSHGTISLLETQLAELRRELSKIDATFPKEENDTANATENRVTEVFWRQKYLMLQVDADANEKAQISLCNERLRAQREALTVLYNNKEKDKRGEKALSESVRQLIESQLHARNDALMNMYAQFLEEARTKLQVLRG